MLKEDIVGVIKKATGVVNIHLESPENEAFGDYSTNIALQSKNPREEAEKLVAKLKRNPEAKKLFEKIEVAGPGFINFWLKKEYLVNQVNQSIKDQEGYGKTDKNRGKRVMFEYGQPNTHKLPHIGHLFSYIYGEAMTRLLELTGWQVHRVNYQGDVGLHVAKCLWALQKKDAKTPNSLQAKVEFLQKMYEEGSKAYEEDEKAKKEIQEINNKIYKKDPAIAKIWQETRAWSLDYYKNFEKRLGINYDRYYYESEVGEKGREKVLQNIPKVFKVSQGAYIFPGSESGLHDRVFVTSDGNPTYEAKDLYLEELKMKEWPMDLLVITTASEQNDYFKVVFAALEVTNPEMKGKLKHVGFGMVNLKTGKMSSRTGEIIGAVELVDTVVDRVRAITKKNKELKSKEVDQISEVVGFGAVKYSFLKNNPLQDTKFDIEESIAAEGNSGPYLQYTVARTNSVLAKARNPKSEIRNKSKVSNFENSNLDIVSKFDIRNSGLNEEELSVLRSLIKFPEVVETAAEAYSPNLLCNYLYNLAQKFNHFYARHQILPTERANSELVSDNTCPILTNTDPSVTNFRLFLTKATGLVLRNGLKLLGIEAPERM